MGVVAAAAEAAAAAVVTYLTEARYVKSRAFHSFEISHQRCHNHLYGGINYPLLCQTTCEL